MPHGTEVHALDSSWPPTHACPAAVTQYPCASVASKSCMTWHDLIAVMTSALWLLVLHPAINFHSMRIEMSSSAVVSISGPPLDLQYSTVAVPGQLSEKEKKAVAKMDKKMGTVEEEPDEPSDSQPHDDDDDEPNAGSSKPAKSQAKSKAKAKAMAKAEAKAKQVAKAKKASTMKKPAKALQKKPSQK